MASPRLIPVAAHVRSTPAKPAEYVAIHAELRTARSLDNLARELERLVEDDAFQATGGLAH